MVLNYTILHTIGQRGGDGCGTWTRTMIDGFKDRCPTFRRSRNTKKLYYMFVLNKKKI